MNQIKKSETYKQFMFEIPHLIFKEVAIATNQLVGLSKTSSMVAQLFTALPIKIELRYIADLPKPSKKLNCLNEYTTAYLKHDDATTINIAFFYSSEKHIKHIAKAITKFPTFFAYLYMRESLKLTRLMNTKTHYQMMSSIIKRSTPKIPVEMHYRLATKANEYAINNTIMELFKVSPIGNFISTVLENQNYSKQYENMMEPQILPIILTNHTGEYTLLDEVFSIDEDYLISTNHPLLVEEHIITDLGETIQNHLGNMARGTVTESIFAETFTAKKVNTGWFKKLTAKFTSEVYHMTDEFYSDWSNINPIYRHIYKAPEERYESNKISIVLSIDHSGSVSTEGLEKLLYLVNRQGKRIANLIVLIHDTEIVKEFNLSSNDNISDDPEFKSALVGRYAAGGTSHKDVFSRIDELIKNKEVDERKTIYVCFSDMYSDIPEAIKVYPSVKRLSPIWLSCGESIPEFCGGTNIAMQ